MPMKIQGMILNKYSLKLNRYSFPKESSKLCKLYMLSINIWKVVIPQINLK